MHEAAGRSLAPWTWGLTPYVCTIIRNSSVSKLLNANSSGQGLGPVFVAQAAPNVKSSCSSGVPCDSDADTLTMDPQHDTQTSYDSSQFTSILQNALGFQDQILSIAYNRIAVAEGRAKGRGAQGEASAPAGSVAMSGVANEWRWRTEGGGLTWSDNEGFRFPPGESRRPDFEAATACPRRGA